MTVSAPIDGQTGAEAPHPTGQSNVPFLNNHQDLSIRPGYRSTYRHKQFISFPILHYFISLVHTYFQK